MAQFEVSFHLFQYLQVNRKKLVPWTSQVNDLLVQIKLSQTIRHGTPCYNTVKFDSQSLQLVSLYIQFKLLDCSSAIANVILFVALFHFIVLYIKGNKGSGYAVIEFGAKSNATI